MRTWIVRFSVTALLLLLIPLSNWLQVLVDAKIGDDDGQITLFYIAPIVSALPSLIFFILTSLYIWWLRSFLANRRLVLSICCVIAAVGFLEFVADVFLASRTRDWTDERIHRQAHPYIAFKGTVGSQQYNELGYYGEPPTAEKGKNEHRVFMIGGSTVRFGTPPIPGLIQEYLNEAGLEQVKVFNYGVSASVSGMELARLVHEILPYDPDTVIIYNGSNDMQLNLLYDPRPGYPYNFMVYENHPLYLDDYPAAALALYGSGLARIVGSRYFNNRFTDIERLRRESGIGSETWDDQIAERYVNNMLTAAKIADAYGSNFILVLQPTLASKSILSDEEQAHLDATIEYARQRELGWLDLVAREDSIRQLIRQKIPGERTFYFEDLSDIYDGERQTVFKDTVHTLQNMKGRVAEAIYQILVSENQMTPQDERISNK